MTLAKIIIWLLLRTGPTYPDILSHFFRGLGMRLGQKNDWPWETYEDVIAYRVERAGVSYDQFIEDGIVQPPQGMEFEKHKNRLPNGQLRGFATPSRKAEIFPSIIQELGYDPIPRYREPMESKD